MSDEPRQSVRPILPGEPLPAYSTAALLLGARHDVLKPAIKVEGPVEEKPGDIAPKRRGGFKGGATQKRLAEERFHGHEKRLRELLEQSFTNQEIAEKIGIHHSAIKRYIYARPELKALSVTRREIRLKRSIKNLRNNSEKITQAAIERFEKRVPIIAAMLEQGRSNAYIAAELDICERLVMRYIARSPQLKELSKKRVEAKRKSAPSKLDQIRGPIAEMRAAGLKEAAIARELGMGRGNLWKYMREIEQENDNVAN